MRLAALLLAMALGGCSGVEQPVDENGLAPPLDLESAAIERGLIRDPDDSEIAGLYARDTDRICVVASGSGYRVGAFVDYGDGITCSGAGTLNRSGETLRIKLGEGDSCSFDARFDGERVVFPGTVPDGCAALCSRRASLAGLEVSRLSESPAEAAALRDSAGKLLCSGG